VVRAEPEALKDLHVDVAAVHVLAAREAERRPAGRAAVADDADPDGLELQVECLGQVQRDPDAVGRVVPAVTRAVFPGVTARVQEQSERAELHRIAGPGRDAAEPAEPDLQRPAERVLPVEERHVDPTEVWPAAAVEGKVPEAADPSIPRAAGST